MATVTVLNREALTAFVVITVTTIWALVFAASIITEEYTPLTIASGPMLGVVAYITGIKIRESNGK